ncbi:MAG: sigma-70 family RNA polymerase sigma factor [Acidobacteria bacterium]|nr:sigma-70 family RNA polymerase sigma factor [Acidobacteriota bacterium]
MDGGNGELEQAIDALIQGNRSLDHFATIFRAFYPKAVLFLVRKGVRPSDAEDIAQETMLAVYHGADQVRQADAFPAWLFQIVRSRMSNFFKHSGALRRSPGAQAEPIQAASVAADGQPSALDGLLRQERVDRLISAIDELPPQMRQCVRIRVVEDASCQEIAQTLGLSVNTVKAHLFKARHALAARLRTDLSEEDV